MERRQRTPAKDEGLQALLCVAWAVRHAVRLGSSRSRVPDIESYIAKHDNKSACKLARYLAGEQESGNGFISLRGCIIHGAGRRQRGDQEFVADWPAASSVKTPATRD